MPVKPEAVKAEPRTVAAGRIFPEGTFIMEFPATLKAIVTKEESGFSATLPALPGCFTEADTIEELSANLREAAEGWMEVQLDHAKMESIFEGLNPLKAKS